MLVRDDDFADGSSVGRVDLPLLGRAEGALNDLGMVAAFDSQIAVPSVRLALS